MGQGVSRAEHTIRSNERGLICLQYTNQGRNIDNLRRSETMSLMSGLRTKSLGMLLLGLWLIFTGLLPLINTRISSTISTALAVLAIVAGILILLGR